MANRTSRKGWRTVRFGDVVRQVKETIDPQESGLERYVAGEHMDTDDFRIRRWGLIGDGYLGPAFHMRFKPGQVLYGSRRTYLRKVAVADFEGICANTTYVLESKDPNVLRPDLLPFIMQTEAFHAHSIKQSKGSVNPYINFSDLVWYEFMLPPIEEQHRYLLLLEKANRATEACRSVVERHGILMSSAIENLIIPEGRSPSSEEPLGVPGWRLDVAESLTTELITKGATPPGQLAEQNTGLPFIKVYNLTFEGDLDFSINPTYITVEGHRALLRSQVVPGDVLMNIVGPPLGKVALVPDGFPEGNINQAIVRYRCRTPELAIWLQFYLRSITAQRWLLKRSKKTSGQRNLTLALCRELPVPVPPETTLRSIITKLVELDRIRRVIATRQAASTLVREVVTNHLFGLQA